MRADGRQAGELRPLSFQRRYTRQAAGSVLVRSGVTTVLCTCSVQEEVPEFLQGSGKGWLTAEYSMLPGSTSSRKARDRSGKVDGRSVEIQRLIGRSLRAVVDLEKLGERTLWIDCDVLEADGGTRTASINGAFLALVDALLSRQGVLPVPLKEILRDSVAAVSVGLVSLPSPESRTTPAPVELLDLDYREDRDADVDLNLVLTGRGQIIEVQAGGEEATFSREQLERLLNLGHQGIAQITTTQRDVLGSDWPLD